MDFDFKNLSYRGKEKIYCSLDDELVLDAIGFSIHSVRINGKEIDYNYDGEKLRIKTGKFDGTIEVDFTGKVRERELVGIYKAPYDGGKNYIVSTQFESNHARKFIPCVDHPSYKAVFKIQVRVDKDLDVISNMPIQKVTEEGDKKLVEFYETPKMSTYLLYLGVGKFEEIKDELDGIQVIVASVPGKISKGRFSLEVGKKVINFYNEYFGIKYQLPKEHLIAIPEFAFGAMENWGAITFRETALLADEKSSVIQRMRVAEVVAHELAHQWFGDLVTMKWWDDLWLNESFATFMSYKAIDHLFPNWDMFGDFIHSETSGAMLRDSLSTTHPIEAHVKSPEEIEQIFDDISYGKGASILRMIEGYMGKEAFQKGIQNYLQKYKFSNAEGQDFWNSLQEASGLPIADVVKDWITKRGYPAVKVEVEGTKIRLYQERFSLTPLNENTTYLIPLTLEVNGKRITQLMKEQSMTIDVGSEVKSLKVNLDRVGFYRVEYDNLDLFLNANPNHYERWGLLDDYYNLLLAGRISYEVYENAVKELMNDDNYLVVDEIRGQLFFLWTVNPSKYTLITDFLELQLPKWSKRTDDLSQRVYGNLLRSFAYVDDRFAQGLSISFDNYDSLNPNLKEAVAIAYAITQGENGYDELLRKYREEKFDEEKQRILNAMLSFREPYLVVNTLSLALNGEIKRQDTARIIPLASANPYSRFAVWRWTKTYMEFLRSIYAGTGILGRSFRGAIPYLGLNIPEVEEYFTSNKFPEMEVEIKSALEILKALKRLS